MRSNPAKGMSAVAVAVVLTACSGPTLPSTSPDCSAFTPSSPDIVCVTGTVHYFGFEGGFWAVRGDNDMTYDPLDRVKTKQEPFGLSLTYTFDAADNPIVVSDTAGGVVDSGYDPNSNLTRRSFFQGSSLGLGSLALSQLLGEARADVAGITADRPLAPRAPHFAPKAKRVIYLHMSGAPPHLDLLDYKPELVKHDGENCPDQYLKGKRFAFTSGVPKLLGTKQPFKQRGKSGGVGSREAGSAKRLKALECVG